MTTANKVRLFVSARSSDSFMNVNLIHLAGLSKFSNIVYAAKVIVTVCVDDFLKPGTFVRISLN